MELLVRKKNQKKRFSPLLEKLLKYYERIWALTYLNALADWDLNTYMPKAGARLRGKATAAAQIFVREIYTSRKFQELIAEAEQKKLDATETGIVRILKHEAHLYNALPESFISEFEQTVNEAQLAWVKAKDTNQAQIFLPYLKTIIRLSREKAEYLGYQENPYDALLDQFEQGLDSKTIKNYFKELLQELRALVYKNKDQNEDYFASSDYSESKMKLLNSRILSFLGGFHDKLRMDVSSHPFTQAMSADDVRITTRYPKANFTSSLLSTIHEFGHALYEMNCDSYLEMTPAGGGVSLILHESQSRFWENFIGRSAPFLNVFKNDIAALSPQIKSELKTKGIEGLSKSLSMIKPGLIRVDADEVTYHFHIELRFRIEMMLINRQLDAEDVPAYWNESIFKALGVKVKTDSEGFLQDIHWSMGSIGYFPTYSMGTVLSATWLEQLETELGSITNLVTSEEGIASIRSWLQNNIHVWGSVYTMGDLVKKITGKPFSVKPYLKYVQKKFHDQL